MQFDAKVLRVDAIVKGSEILAGIRISFKLKKRVRHLLAQVKQSLQPVAFRQDGCLLRAQSKKGNADLRAIEHESEKFS